MTVDRDKVLHIARLVALELPPSAPEPLSTEDELDELARSMTALLARAERLARLDLSGIALEDDDVFVADASGVEPRADEPAPGHRQALLDGAPEVRDGLVSVPPRRRS